MIYNQDFHHRRSIRLKGYDYSQSGAYYITICIKNRECLFGDVMNGKIKLSQIGRIVSNEWLNTENIRKNIELDKWVIMPNHLHGIILIHSDRSNVGATRWVAQKSNGPKPNSIGSIIGQFKSITTKKINRLRFKLQTCVEI